MENHEPDSHKILILLEVRFILMPEYRRVLVPGGTFFLTVVTLNRCPFLTSDVSRQTLRRAWTRVQEKHPLKCDGICLLPEHIHCKAS